MKLVVDASVFVAAADKADTAHAKAKEFLAHAASSLGWRVLCPALVLPETAAAIARLTRDSGKGDVAALRVLALPGLRLVALSEGLARQAARRASRYFLKGADAIYVALAATAKAPLITLDEEMLERGAAAAKTMTPADWLKTAGVP